MPSMARRESIQFPQALRPGDAVRLITPASPYDKKRMRAGMKVLEQMGYVPLLDEGRMLSSGGRRYLANSDEARAELLVEALREKESRAVWAIRGGYGSARLLPLAKIARVKGLPKWLIGFSDITALHLARWQAAKIVGLHGPVLTQLAELPKTQLRWLADLLAGEVEGQELPLGASRCVMPGKIRGRLVGGNLSMLASLVGTPYQPNFRGGILMLEDVGEPTYRLDRAWTQLLQAGVFKGLKGLVLGQWVRCLPAGRSRHGVRAVMESLALELGVPCVSGATFGHAEKNVAWPVGLLAELDAKARTLRLLEDAAR